MVVLAIAVFASLVDAGPKYQVNKRGDGVADKGKALGKSKAQEGPPARTKTKTKTKTKRKAKAKAPEKTSAGLSTEAFINGISGFYQIDRNLHGDEQQNKWYTVKITWAEDKGAFKWQNRAGVTWTLTPQSGASGGWDETKLTVGNDCPYKNDGHEFAKIEWVSSEVQCTLVKRPSDIKPN